MNHILLSSTLSLTLSAAGCSPAVENGQFACDPDDPEPCPPGMACMLFADRHQCHRPGPWHCGNEELELPMWEMRWDPARQRPTEAVRS